MAKEKPEGCIFCSKPRAGDDRKNHIVQRGDYAFVMLNTYPYNNGHIMISPFEHVAGLEDLSSATLHEMMDLSQRCLIALKKGFSAEGFNVGFNLGAVGGAGIRDHVHLHIVPRWMGDTNFMPVIADTRVIPQSLDATYEQLAEALSQNGGNTPAVGRQ